jgi:hypothetical protein
VISHGFVRLSFFFNAFNLSSQNMRPQVVFTLLLSALAVLHGVVVSAAAAATFNSPACDPAVSKPGAARAMAVKFLKDNVNGKSVSEPTTTFPVAGGKVESVSSTTVRFGNFTETKSGFFFDAETTAAQTLYELGPDGKRVAGKGQNKDRRYTWRYQLGERRSTGQLVGAAFPVGNAGAVVDEGDYPFSVYAVTVCPGADGSFLRVAQSSVLYQDLYAKGGGWRPGVEELVATYRLSNNKDKKLEREIKLRGYDVEARTFEKKLSDDLPVRVQREKK